MVFVPGSAGRARRCPRSSTSALSCAAVSGLQTAGGAAPQRTHDVKQHGRCVTSYIKSNNTSGHARDDIASRLAFAQPSLLPSKVTLNINEPLDASLGNRFAEDSLAQSPHLRPLWRIFLHLTALHSPPPRVKRDGQLQPSCEGRYQSVHRFGDAPAPAGPSLRPVSPPFFCPHPSHIELQLRALRYRVWFRARGAFGRAREARQRPPWPSPRTSAQYGIFSRI